MPVAATVDVVFAGFCTLPFSAAPSFVACKFAVAVVVVVFEIVHMPVAVVEARKLSVAAAGHMLASVDRIIVFAVRKLVVVDAATAALPCAAAVVAAVAVDGKHVVVAVAAVLEQTFVAKQNEHDELKIKQAAL